MMEEAFDEGVHQAVSDPPQNSMIHSSLICHGLVKSFGGVRAVNDVSAQFEAGKITALMGPNGAGKTTIFHLLTGTLRPDSGRIDFKGGRIDHLSAWQIARLGVGRLFQDVRVFPKLSVFDNVMVAFRDQIGESPICSLLRRGAVLRQERELLKMADHWLHLVGLESDRSALAETLSYGQQKLLAISRLLAAGSDVLLLDEPTAGVNPNMVSSLVEVINRLAQEGKTVVMIEHDVSVIMEVADLAYFVEAGRITAFGKPSAVMNSSDTIKAYLGM